MNMNQILHKRRSMKVKRWIYVLSILLLAVALSACGTSNGKTNNENSGEEAKETTSLKGNSEKAGSNQVVEVELINSQGEKTGTLH